MENSDEIIKALCKAQGLFPVIKKNREGQSGHIKHSYADLAEIFETTQKICSDNGLCHTFLIVPKAETVSSSELQTILMHTSGQSFVSRYDLGNLGSLDDKKAGIKISYAKRYSLKAILGLEESDDPHDNGWGADKPGDVRDVSRTPHQKGKSQNTQTPRNKANTSQPRNHNGGSANKTEPKNHSSDKSGRVTIGDLKGLWKNFEAKGFTKEQAAQAVKIEFNKTSVELTKAELNKLCDLLGSLGIAILEQGEKSE